MCRLTSDTQLGVRQLGPKNELERELQKLHQLGRMPLSGRHLAILILHQTRRCAPKWLFIIASLEHSLLARLRFSLSSSS